MVAAGRCAAALALLFAAADGARINKRSRASSACGVKGDSGPSSQIVNGQPATECAWRWQAQLLWEGGGSPFCGGTLITPEWVLTAAHCMVDDTFDVRVGEFNISATSANQQTRKAVKILKHPQYNERSQSNDFAMVRLESPVTLGDCVGTACLPSEGADVQPGTRCWITGWGTLKTGGSTPKILQEAEVKIISNEDCVMKFGYLPSQIDESMICAQGRTADGKISDACQGDSGGPLVCESSGRWTVYGATSWGMGCAGENYPGIWARVHQQLDWVEDILAGKEPTAPPAPPKESCPSEYSTGPDSEGGCQCHGGLRCYKDGVLGRCPVFWGYSERWFMLSCGPACICK